MLEGSNNPTELLERAAGGNQTNVEQLFSLHRDRLTSLAEAATLIDPALDMVAHDWLSPEILRRKAAAVIRHHNAPHP